MTPTTVGTQPTDNTVDRLDAGGQPSPSRQPDADTAMRPGDEVRDGDRIVVGVDGSPDARRALEWVMRHAQPEDSIDVVHTWHLPAISTETGLAIDDAILQRSAVAVLERELHLVRADYPDGPSVTTRAVRGHPGRALLEAAKDADLLVVGTRGHGGFAGLLLGSTSTYLAHHSPCPLVIVPASHHRETA